LRTFFPLRSGYHIGELIRIDGLAFGRFDRVKVADPSATVRSVKGAIHFARESQPHVKSLLPAEDPATGGEPFRDTEPGPAGTQPVQTDRRGGSRHNGSALVPQRLDRFPFAYAAIGYLRDGSILGPLKVPPCKHCNLLARWNSFSLEIGSCLIGGQPFCYAMIVRIVVLLICPHR